MSSRANSPRTPRSGAADPGVITSRDNRWLKEFRIALRGGLPSESGAVGVEGPRLVEEALRSASPIRAVLFSESGERHRSRLALYLDRPEVAIPVLRTTDRLFEGIADTEHPQGVAALVTPRTFSFDDISRPASGRRGPADRGARWRTRSRQRWHHYSHRRRLRSHRRRRFPFRTERHRQPVLSKSTARLGRSRASSSAARWRGIANPAGAIPRYAGIQSLASSSRESRDESEQPLLTPWQVDWRQPVALLIGNEGQGLPEEIERSADARIRIPMSSSVESLNAAAAAAVLFYEAARQRSSLTS